MSRHRTRDASIAAFAEAVAANQQAALVARQVVRASETLAVPEAIDVESLGYSTLQGGPEFAAWLAGRGPRPLPPPSDEPVLIAREGDLLHITLNRPERRNAYGTVLRDALVDALRLAVVDGSIERVVLDGAGSSFCAGGDLDEFGRTPDITLAHFVRTRGGAGRLVAQLAGRMEVRLHGHCIGAGIEIPAFAGRVVATSGTVFRLPEVSMGLIPGAGGTVSIPRRIGRWRSLHLFVTLRPSTPPAHSTGDWWTRSATCEQTVDNNSFTRDPGFMSEDGFTPPNPSRERAHREYAGLFRIAERHGSTPEQRARQSHPEMLDPLGAIRLVAALAGGVHSPGPDEPEVDDATSSPRSASSRRRGPRWTNSRR